MSNRICFVMPTMSGGGAERVVSVLANEFIKAGYDVTLMLTNSTQIVYDLDKRIHIDTGCVTRKLGFIGQIRAIREKMKAVSEMAFISMMDDQNLFTLLAGIGQKNKVIISQRNDPHRAFGNRRFISKIHPWLYTCADKVVFQTYDARDFYPKYARRKYHVILNPLNEKLPIREVSNRSKRVVTVCRLHAQKNLALAIDAFKELNSRFPEYVFEIYGEGEKENELRRHVHDIGLDGKVLFKGFRKDIYDCIYDATMFVLSSDFEGLSNSMIEALALGIPTIATDCPIGGSRMVIENGVNGYLVPIRNKERLADAMIDIASHPDVQRRFSEQSSLLRQKLSAPSIARQWLSVIQSA